MVISCMEHGIISEKKYKDEIIEFTTTQVAMSSSYRELIVLHTCIKIERRSLEIRMWFSLQTQGCYSSGISLDQH